jgi:hypothetical protein
MNFMAPAVLASALVAACGLGTYDDSGQPQPQNEYAWVCPDGGSPVVDDASDASTCEGAAADASD